MNWMARRVRISRCIQAITRSLSQLEEQIRSLGLEFPAGKYGKRELILVLSGLHPASPALVILLTI